MMKNKPSSPYLNFLILSQNRSHPCSQRLVRLMQQRLHDCVSVTMIHTDSQFT